MEVNRRQEVEEEVHKQQDRVDLPVKGAWKQIGRQRQQVDVS